MKITWIIIAILLFLLWILIKFVDKEILELWKSSRKITNDYLENKKNFEAFIKNVFINTGDNNLENPNIILSGELYDIVSENELLYSKILDQYLYCAKKILAWEEWWYKWYYETSKKIFKQIDELSLSIHSILSWLQIATKEKNKLNYDFYTKLQVNQIFLKA